MRIAISIEHRFFKYQGSYYDNSVYTDIFWKPYLEVYDEIVIIARIKQINNITSSYVRINDPRISFYELFDYKNSYLSLWDFFKNMSILSRSFQKIDGLIIRTPCVMGYFLGILAIVKQLHFSIELVGDIKDISKTERLSFRRLFNRYISYNIIKFQCKKATIVNYVTNSYLQKRYPTFKENTFSWSDAIISENSISASHKTYREKKIYHFIYTASFSPYKGHIDLVNIFNKIDDNFSNWKLTLIGDGFTRNLIYKEFERKGLINKVEFTGILSNQLVNQKLDKSDIYISTSYTEGLPRAIIEAISKGLPVIGYNVGGINELVSSRCLVSNKDINALIDLILFSISHPEFLEEESIQNLNKAYCYTPSKIYPIRMDSYKKFRNIIYNIDHSL